MNDAPKDQPIADQPPLDEVDDDEDEAFPGADLDLGQEDAEPGSLARGAQVIKSFWRHAPNGPGVYRMFAADRTIAAARILFPVGIAKELFLTDSSEAYAGVVLVSDLHAVESQDAATVDSLAHWGEDFLVPQSTIRAALDLFEKSEADVLPVLADAQSRRIVGRLSEAHALREYGRELEKRNRELITR